MLRITCEERGGKKRLAMSNNKRETTVNYNKLHRTESDWVVGLSKTERGGETDVQSGGKERKNFLTIIGGGCHVGGKV